MKDNNKSFNKKINFIKFIQSQSMFRGYAMEGVSWKVSLYFEGEFMLNEAIYDI